jgi:predicted  nucleic acid-binding Zn-ribbon protein
MASGGAAERAIELFTKGLLPDGTHTRMSATAEGDAITIAGDGWCLYSSFLVAFEKYNKYFSAESDIENRAVYRHAIAQQFVRLLAKRIYNTPTLLGKLCIAILQDAQQYVEGEPTSSNVFAVKESNAAGGVVDTGKFGYRLDEKATDADTTWVERAGDKFKYVSLGAAFDREKALELLGTNVNAAASCPNFDFAEFLRNTWKSLPGVERSAALYGSPMMYGDATWVEPVLNSIMPWIITETKLRRDSPPEKKGTHLFFLKEPTGAHFDSVVFEYIPDEAALDPFVALGDSNGQAMQQVESFVAGSDDVRAAMEKSWDEDWTTFVKGGAPPLPVAADSLDEAAATVADLMGAVANAGEALLPADIEEDIVAASAVGALTPDDFDDAYDLFVEKNPDMVTEEEQGQDEEPNKPEPAVLIDFDVGTLPMVPAGEIEAAPEKPLTKEEFATLLASMPTPIGDVDAITKFQNMARQIEALLAAPIDNTTEAATLGYYLRLIRSYLIHLTVFQMKPASLGPGQVDQIEPLRTQLNQKARAIEGLRFIHPPAPATEVADVVQPSVDGIPPVPSDLTSVDRDAVVKRLDILETYLGGVPTTIKAAEDGDTIRSLIDKLQADLGKQQASVEELQKLAADVQKSGIALSQEQKAAFDALVARVDAGVSPADLAPIQRQLTALAAKASKDELTTLAAGTIPADLAAQLKALSDRFAALEGQLDAAPAAPASIQTDIEQIRGNLRALDLSIAATGVQKGELDVAIAKITERLAKIEERTAVAGPKAPLSLADTTARLDEITKALDALNKAAEAVAAKDKATQDALIGLHQQLAALQAVRATLTPKKEESAAVSARIQIPTDTGRIPGVVPWQASFAPSWFNPADRCGLRTTKECTAGRIAADLTGFQSSLAGLLVERPNNANQAQYRTALEELEKSPGPDQKKKLDKIVAAFPYRTVFIDGERYTVRNPYASLKERMDASDGFFMDSVPEEGSSLRPNVQLLQAFAPPAQFGEFLVDNKRAIAILESLWHCGNQPGTDLDPKCFPARIVEELREYNEIMVKNKGKKDLEEEILKLTGLPTIIAHLQRLLAMAQKKPSAAASAPAASAPAASAPAANSPKPSPASPVIRRKPLLPMLTPGLGGVSVGGRRMPFIAPGLGFTPVIPDTE